MDYIIYGGLFCLGAVIASFAGVIAERINTGESWVRGRSRCNSCGEELGARDLVPVVSWLLSRGRCRHCGSRVPAQYPAFELLLGIAFALSYSVIGPVLALAPFLVALAVLAFIVLYDLRHTIVPPTASSLLFALSFSYALLAFSEEALAGIFITSGVIGLFFLALHVFSRGKAMGLGDAPVALALSCLAGPFAFSGLLFSFWIGALCGIVLLVVRRGGPRMGIEVPFVPYMALGFLLSILIQWNPLDLS